jgi:hypothetical protein
MFLNNFKTGKSGMVGGPRRRFKRCLIDRANCLTRLFSGVTLWLSEARVLRVTPRSFIAGPTS